MNISCRSVFSMLVLCAAVFALGACKPEPVKVAPEPEPVAVKPAEAVIITASLPPEMMVAGQPIDPLCFQGKMEDNAETALQNVNLNACRGAEIVLDQGATLQPDVKGFISYRYGYNGDGGTQAQIDSLAGYYYLGQKDGLMVVLSVLNSGGSGTFTHIATYRRSGDTMSMVTSFAAGDRCNGGIAGARLVNGTVLYDINMTPADILAEIGMKSQTQFNLSADVDSSAASCFGTGAYQNEVLTEILLSATAAKAAPTSSSKYQPCYNNLQNLYIKANGPRLTGRDFIRFSSAFRAQCLRR